MQNFHEWEFLLSGNAQEMRGFTRTQGTNYFHIYGGIDHWNDCPNDDFRMTTIYCEDETDPNMAWQIGHELVSLFNGASILFGRNYRKIHVERLLHNDREVTYQPKLQTAALLGKPKLNYHQILSEISKAKEASIKLWLISLATENEDVYLILKYLDMTGDWLTYYKLMETIETLAKRNSIDLNTNASNRKSFTNTANNYSLSGFNSRHGFKEVTKENKTSSMSIEDAHAFVTKMAKTYLQQAYEKTGS